MLAGVRGSLGVVLSTVGALRVYGGRVSSERRNQRYAGGAASGSWRASSPELCESTVMGDADGAWNDGALQRDPVERPAGRGCLVLARARGGVVGATGEYAA